MKKQRKKDPAERQQFPSLSAGSFLRCFLYRKDLPLAGFPDNSSQNAYRKYFTPLSKIFISCSP